AAGDPPVLPSFPTRRSSDLAAARPRALPRAEAAPGPGPCARARPAGAGPRRARLRPGPRLATPPAAGGPLTGGRRGDRAGLQPRSEEHTSELQSRFDLVCRL